MKVLVVGGGGREHAICWKLAQSPKVSELYCAPGNGGIAQVAQCVPIKATDVEGMVAWAKDNAMDFVMVAPDDPLALGMVDALEAAGIPAFGPRANAAILEASKAFSKELMKKYHIPTAQYETFTDMEQALAYIHRQGAPIVVKADGLALGKGVVVASTVEEAEEAVRSMMQDHKFGKSGSTVVIEECMVGPEVTVLAFCDGEHLVPMLSSQDHKRAYDGNQGPNTGGMGAFCPSPNYTPAIAAECMEKIFLPTVKAMQAEGRPFQCALLRSDAHPGRPQGGGVQRPLRRPGNPAHPVHAGHRPDGYFPGLRQRHPGSGGHPVEGGRGLLHRPGLRRLPRPVSERLPHLWSGGGRQAGHRVPCGHQG